MTITDLWLTPDGIKHWKTVKMFSQTIDGKTVIVPKDFRTDLASVPRIFWSLIPPFGNWSKSAVVHDYMCIYDNLFTRKEADQIFYKSMIENKVYKWKAKLMYLSVMIYGRLKRGKNYGKP